uniref:ABC transporter domain-containing protein n=1 Tax=Fagus sylvatica TaxID=28930 RepID=A0A2N9HX99_FAGSY
MHSMGEANVLEHLLVVDVEEPSPEVAETKFRIVNLTKESDAGVPILNGINAEIPKGVIVGIIGPSGSGKSTMLRALNRLWEPPLGTVFLDGRDIRDLDVLTLRRKVGMLFQLPALFEDSQCFMVLPTRLEKLMVRKTPDLRHYTAFILLLLSSGEANGGRRSVAVGSGEGSRVLDLARTVPDLMRKTPDLSRRTPFDEVTDLLLWIQRCSGGTVASNVRYGPQLRGKKLSDEEVHNLLRLADLDSSFFNKTGGELSVGQAQRVALARTLANEPEVLLLDEPTSALDPISTENIEDVLVNLKNKQGMTIIMVSHSIKQIRRIADVVCLLVEGEIVEVLKPDKLSEAKHPMAQRFLELS